VDQSFNESAAVKNFEDVSVVVCTYNRAEYLRATLQSLARLVTEGLFAYEIVVVDNASSDHTQQVIEECAAELHVPIRSVFEPRPGVSCARNRGVAEARFDWIAFFDDDQLADATWLLELVRAAARHDARCVGGSNQLAFEGGSMPLVALECRALLSESFEGLREYRYSRRSAPGCGNLLIHRSVFDQVGTFNERLAEAGEDADLFRRIYAAGLDAWYTPNAISRHVVPLYRLTTAYIRWKALRNGSHVARRNFSDWNRPAFVGILAARISKAIGLDLPRYLWMRLTKPPEIALGARSRLWRTEGYARLALNLLAPRYFEQRRFFSELEFRAERTAFATSEALSQLRVG
jgi:glycosyltransferase involved in cell wall biosynthesis